MQNRPSLQRGFVGAGLMDLAFLFVLILIGLGLWYWFSSIVTGDFMLAVAMLWLMAAGAGWWFAKDHRLFLRVPAGVLVFVIMATGLAPLTGWSGSKLAVGTAALSAVLAAKYLGAWWSGRIDPKVMPGIPVPWYLDQSIDMVDDLARWIGACFIAWFVVLLAMLLGFMLPLEWVPWGALVWGFVATAAYLYQYRKSRVRLFKVPLGIYVFAATAVLLQLFQRQIVGALEPGSFELIAYTAYWPVVSALFIEIVAVGTRRNPI